MHIFRSKMKRMLIVGGFLYTLLVFMLNLLYLELQKSSANREMQPVSDSQRPKKGLIVRAIRSSDNLEGRSLRNILNLKSTKLRVSEDCSKIDHPVVGKWCSLVNPIIPLKLPIALYNKLHTLKDNTLGTWLTQIQCTMEYPNFEIPMPIFVDDNETTADKESELFSTDPENRESLGYQRQETLLGNVSVLTNLTILKFTDCGWQTTDAQLIRYGSIVYPELLDEIVIPLLIPDSSAFQHFIDGVLPKLIQVLDVALLPGVKLFILPPRDDIIFDILGTLGFGHDKLILYQGEARFRSIINTCKTPPLHPLLWQAARSLLNIPLQTGSSIILITRRRTNHGGRKMQNVEQVKNFLTDRYYSNFVTYDEPHGLQDTVGVFGKARIIIGVHGGGLYNMMFAPAGVTIVEIMPTLKNGHTINEISPRIIWMQAKLLSQVYYRLQVTPESANGDLMVPLARLQSILDIVDNKT